MDLPNQTTTEELKATLDEKLSALKQQQVPEAAVQIEAVRGARVEESARGAALLRPTTERVCELPAFASTAEIVYSGLPAGRKRLSTGSARLIKAYGTWREEGLTGPWQGEHFFSGPAGTCAVWVHLPDATSTPVLPPEPAPPSMGGPNVYEVPPAATAIRGEGALRYRSGHVVSFSGEETILRPRANGDLGIRPGGAYCTAHAHSAPDVKLGLSWIPLTPTDETPAA